MDTHISTEAVVKLDELVTRVERGEEVVIEREGTPVARVVATGRTETREARRERLQALGRELLHARAGKTTGGIGWKALRDEGRKW